MKSLFALLLLAASPVWADSFEAGNRAFAEARYSDAIMDYRKQLVESGGVSAPLLFNLANAYARAGDKGNAVASYLRAQTLRPEDPAIAKNLAVLVGEPSRSWHERAAQALSMNAWSVLGALAFSLVGLAAALAILGVRRKTTLSVGIIASLAVVVSAAALAIWSQTLDAAVVVQQTAARISPFAAAEAKFTLAPGDVVHMREAHEGFLRVEVKGMSAWVDSSAVTPVYDRT